MVTGPEQARLLKEFEDDYLPQDKDSLYGCRHEEEFCAQKTSQRAGCKSDLGHQ